MWSRFPKKRLLRHWSSASADLSGRDDLLVAVTPLSAADWKAFLDTGLDDAHFPPQITPAARSYHPVILSVGANPKPQQVTVGFDI